MSVLDSGSTPNTHVIYLFTYIFFFILSSENLPPPKKVLVGNGSECESRHRRMYGGSSSGRQACAGLPSWQLSGPAHGSAHAAHHLHSLSCLSRERLSPFDSSSQAFDLEPALAAFQHYTSRWGSSLIKLR